MVNKYKALICFSLKRIVSSMYWITSHIRMWITLNVMWCTCVTLGLVLGITCLTFWARHKRLVSSWLDLVGGFILHDACGELTDDHPDYAVTFFLSFKSHVFHIRLHFLPAFEKALLVGLSRWSSAVLNPHHILFRLNHLLVLNSISLLFLHLLHLDVVKEIILWGDI